MQAMCVDMARLVPSFTTPQLICRHSVRGGRRNVMLQA